MPDFRTFLILARSTPYGNHEARAAIDLALTAAAFEQDVRLVFLDKGILQLLKEQDTGPLGLRTIGKMIPALKLFEVDKIFACEKSMLRLNLTLSQLEDGVKLIKQAEIKSMINSADQVMVF